jgi:hypothetical protein
MVGMGWTMAGNLELPMHTKSSWQIVKITAQEARAILDYACWPGEKPESNKARQIEISQEEVTVYELVGAMRLTSFRRRSRELKPAQADKLREMVKQALEGKIYCDGKLNELYKFLNI